MARILSAAPLCTPNATPIEFLEGAAAAGFDHVGIRLKEPEPSSALHSIMETRHSRASLVRRVRELGLKVLEVEAFWINEDYDFDAFRKCIDLAAELSPKFLLVVGNDSDRSRLTDNFCRTVELGKGAGMQTVVEFIPYTALQDMGEAQKLIDASGTDAGHLVDALHLSRSGGDAQDLAIVPKGGIRMLHLCDASAAIPATTAGKRAEARANRMVPGTGSIPLREIIDAVPADTPIEIECPVVAFAHLPPSDVLTRLRKAMLDCIGGEEPESSDVGAGRIFRQV